MAYAWYVLEKAWVKRERPFSLLWAQIWAFRGKSLGFEDFYQMVFIAWRGDFGNLGTGCLN